MKPFASRHRKHRSTKNFLLVLVGVGVLVGCASNTKHKWLNVFFDGVPDPNAPKPTNQVVQQFDENGKPLTGAVFVQSTNFGAAKAPPFAPHPPYDEKKCSECHKSKFSVEMKAPQKKVCFDCHDTFQASFEKLKFKHQPADNGECSSCHDPHGSAFPKMVKHIGKAMCAECHEDPPRKPKFVHQPFENGECLSCHAPHGGADKALSVKPGKTLCFDCHDDFLAKARFQHSVVDDCSSCHNSHKSDETALLTKSRGQLCLECHEQKDLAQSKGHAQMGNTACLQCHDAHVGLNKFLVKPAALTPGTNAKP